MGLGGWSPRTNPAPLSELETWVTGSARRLQALLSRIRKSLGPRVVSAHDPGPWVVSAHYPCIPQALHPAGSAPVYNTAPLAAARRKTFGFYSRGSV